MRQSLILAACLAPLGLIFIIVRLAVWMSAVNAESDYVRREPLRERGPFVACYADVDEEEEEYEIAQTVDNALEEYYSERGLPVPQWKTKRSQWWIDYLKELGRQR